MSAADTSPVVDRGVLRFLTAGSVDDGKSTLIGRLLFDTKADPRRPGRGGRAHVAAARRQALDLSLLTDGLVAEREQGITIDVAYRYFATAARKFIIADTPGHEQYTRNMVTGASTADLADRPGRRAARRHPQTRRHAALAHLLGIPHLVVAVNKMDLVGYPRGRVRRDLRRFPEFAATGGHRRRALRPDVARSKATWSSSAANRLDWYDGPTLLEILETVERRRNRTDAPLRFPVQLVARPTADVAARLHGPHRVGVDRRRRPRAGAAVRTDDDGARHPDLRRLAAEARGRTQSVTLVLADEIDMSRGDMLVANRRAAGRHPRRSTRRCAGWAMRRSIAARRYLLRHTTRTVKAVSSASTSAGIVSPRSASPRPPRSR